jgi:hypothetical protein
MSITSSATIVELNLSVWTGNKIDKDASRKVTDDNYAAAEAGHFRKNLMAGTGKRKEIADMAARCRLWHNTRTLPWADRGGRLLPTSMFLDYKQQLDRMRDQFEAAVAEFINEYPQLVQNARAHLGNLFKPEDYPSQEEVASKFGFRVVFSPVPDSGDFRLDIPAQELEQMKQDYDSAFNDRIADAMREPWERLHGMLTRMSEKLTEPEGDSEIKRRWHHTFVTNVTDLCAMLTHLNLTKDPKLEAARRDLERAISNVDIEDIKEDADVRADTKAKLDNILKSYEW